MGASLTFEGARGGFSGCTPTMATSDALPTHEPLALNCAEECQSLNVSIKAV